MSAAVDPFVATNVQLQVQDAPSGFYNRIQNPNGDYGAWGIYVGGAQDARLTNQDDAGSGGKAFVLDGASGSVNTAGASVNSYFHPVSGGEWVAARVQMRSIPSGAACRMTITAYDANTENTRQVGTVGQFTTNQLQRVQPVQLLASERFIQVGLSVLWNGIAVANRRLVFRAWALATGDSEAALTNMGVPPDLGWTDRSDDVFALKISRAELNVGTLDADVRSAVLDPSTSPVLRAGRRARVVAPLSGTPTPLITGRVDDAPVKYAFDDPAPNRQSRIALSVTDPTLDLGTENANGAYGALRELPALWYAFGEAPNYRLPAWDINGDTGSVRLSSASSLYTDRESKVLDQIVLTRDSVAGYAWVSRDGTLVARSASQMPGTVGTLTEADFGEDIDVSFDLSTVVNVVNVVIRRVNASTGAVVDVPQAGVINRASVEEWGARPATYVVQGIAETTAAVRAFAETIFDANAQPRVRVNKLTLRIASPADLVRHKSHLDLYDRLRVLMPTKGIDQLVRVASIEHDITAERWLMTVGFIASGQVATPQALARL